MSVHVFGVRHHGPGCARALRAALDALDPDIVLVEGPPDAESVLPLLAHEAMKPPVALLLYLPDAPHRAVYYPFTHFSPEWQALRHALARGVPARFMDLPQAIQLATEPEESEDTGNGGQSQEDVPAAADSVHPHTADRTRIAAKTATASSRCRPLARATSRNAAKTATVAAVGALPPVREDPLAMLAEAAGYTDHELWWEQQIEQRRDATGLFEGILEAMTALREDLTPRDREEERREAHMRQSIRVAEREGFQRIAVVCGAWHAPALVQRPAAKDDALALSGLRRVKVESTWIPWTNSRLSSRSGYGAGITSPGWYGHLWEWGESAAIRWMTRAAHLLREEGLDASSASVIEAVRLAEALAAMRGLPAPGMAELHEAIQTVLCNGEAAPMALIREKLEIGEAMGDVPPDAPAVPLQRDLEMKQRRLRMLATPELKSFDLDLRNETDRARSRLLHQLRLLGIEWGKPQRMRGKAGTFHEVWQVRWQPEYVVGLIEANVWGNTVASASSAFAVATANKARDLPTLTALLDSVILAELPDAIERTLERVSAVAAVAAEMRHLMDALPPLARVARYGDVRGTRAERVLPVIGALFERVLVGLPGSCASLDDDAAAAMVTSIDAVQESISLLDQDERRDAWLEVLRGLVDRGGVHGVIRGRCCRLLLEQHALDSDELQRLAGLALSPAVPADAAAAWVEGVLRGSGLLLLHQDGLWGALDAWLCALAPEAFVSLLPLVRRAFSGFSAPERRAMGEKVKILRESPSSGASGGLATHAAGDALAGIDTQRAGRVLPVLAQILGVRYDAHD